MKQVAISVGDRQYGLDELPVPLPLDELLPGSEDWQVELGFGKGRYLLRRAAETPRVRLLGVEMAGAYFRLVQRRARRRALDNVVLIRGEALFVLAAALPRGFASVVHVYFPDPWPKARHQKRRLLDAETVDLVLGLLEPEGLLYLATDHLEYGAAVREILESHPDTVVRLRNGMWQDGARTNYEDKYERSGRPILRLEVRRRAESSRGLLHPAGVAGIVAATCPKSER